MTETVQDRIRKRLAATGLTEQAASVKADLDKSYLRKLFERPGAAPGAVALAGLADALDTSVSYLLTGEEPSPATVKSDVRPVEMQIMPTAMLPNDLPVRGTAAGSHLGGSFQFEGGVVDYVRRPAALIGAMNAYGLYVEGTSMVPEHNPGDLRIVHPDRPARPGDSVVVQVQVSPNGNVEAVIGRLIKRTEKSVFIGKLNPEATVELKRSTVRAIHKVLTMNDLFGV